MKKLTLTAAMLVLAALVPSGAFALVDAALQGGYTFHGDAEIVDDQFDGVRGYQYGVFAHLNVNTSLFMLGFGFATQKGSFTYDADGTDAEFILGSSWGPDVIFMLNISSMTRPYGRIGFSIMDTLKYDYGIEYKSKTRFLNSGWWALGLGFKVATAVIIFAEFQSYTTRMNEEHSLVRYMGNAGIMVAY